SYATRQPAATDPKLVMGYYDADSVRIFDFLAREFAVCDQWFSALPTGTQANRLMAMAGESRIKDNVRLLPAQSLVYDWLTSNDVPWCSFQWAGNPFFTLMWTWTLRIVGSLNSNDNLGSFRRFNDPVSGFRQQWVNGAQIPDVVFIEPKYTDDILSLAPND